MRRFALFLFALTVGSTFAQAQQPDLPPAVKEYSPFITYYYMNPQPEKSKKMLAAIIQKENLEHPWYANRKFVFSLMGANLGDMAFGKEDLVRYYESQFAGALPGGKRIIIRALRTCGDKTTLVEVEKWIKEDANDDVKAELESLQKHLADPKRKRSRDSAPVNPPDLDYLWGDFFASGEYAPISRILDVFDLPDEPKNANLKRAAQFSTQSNFQQHPKLVELVQTKLAERGPDSKKAIEEMIAALKK